MDLLDLDLVVAVAAAGSITHGATHVHLSLPSASARIRALERNLGTALFTRDRRGVTATPAGVLLLRHARTIRTDLDRMTADLAEHAAGGTTVRMLANAAATTGELIPAVNEHLAVRPHVRIDLAERPSRDIVTALAEGRTDLGVVTDSVNLGGLQTRVLRDDPLVLCTHPDDPLAAQPSVDFDAVAERDFVGLHRTGASAATVAYRARLPTIDAVCRAVAAGLASAVLPRHSIGAWLADRRVVAVSIDDPWAVRRLVLAYRSEDDLTASTRGLRDHLLAAF